MLSRLTCSTHRSNSLFNYHKQIPSAFEITFARSSYVKTQANSTSIHPSFYSTTKPSISSSMSWFDRLIGSVSSTATANSNPVSISGLFGDTKPTINADVRAYLNHYPYNEEKPDCHLNLDFYQNRISSKPSPRATIDEIHSNWKGNFSLLESHHGYIQWIFPIREDGMNMHSQPLMLHERAALKRDPQFTPRLLKSYDMMLEFYGMKVADNATGRITRDSNYRARYQHLNRSSHNYLRITRILKCLGEFGQEHLKLPFLLHIVRELTEGALSIQSIGRSARDYWSPVLREEADVKLLQDAIAEVKAQEKKAGKPVVLTEARIQQLLASRDKQNQEDKKIDSAAVSSSAGVTKDVDESVSVDANAKNVDTETSNAAAAVAHNSTLPSKRKSEVDMQQDESASKSPKV